MSGEVFIHSVIHVLSLRKHGHFWRQEKVRRFNAITVSNGNASDIFSFTLASLSAFWCSLFSPKVAQIQPQNDASELSAMLSRCFSGWVGHPGGFGSARLPFE